MIPNADASDDRRTLQLLEATRMVIASTWFREARTYRTATRREQAHLDEEKMAVIVQEVVGNRHGTRFYPEISGVARSFNCYPSGPARASEGVVSLAFGLGKTVVDGDTCLTYSPARPGSYPQFPTPGDWLRSQNRFWRLNIEALEVDDLRLRCSDEEHLVHEYLADALPDGSLDLVASSWDPGSERLLEGPRAGATPVPTFAPILRSEQLPLNDLLVELLDELRDAMASEVEVEFAVTVDRGANPEPSGRFWLLQVRPVPVPERHEVIDLDESASRAICWSEQALGNGSVDFEDVVYVRPDTYTRSANPQIALDLARVNAALMRDGRQCLLIGFGRWGSADPLLGIPVIWSQICQAGAIIEAQPPDMAIDPSQGSHFFHNLMSRGVLYFTLHPSVEHSAVDFDFLDNAGELMFESAHVRHVRLARPITAKVDGRCGDGIVLSANPSALAE